ncbi:MAG TPA: ATP-binding cassette domain-containing protein [Gammaproteobacteria bacterium]|nr:ATP-binding cassette domain-containing protein [Gammaproteobacteria bacterium]
MSQFMVAGLEVRRSGLPVVRGVELEVTSGRISVVLGANGAGKTTFLEGLSGSIPISGGRIVLDGTELQRARPGARARAGLAHIEEGRTVFRHMTLDQNLRVASHPSTKGTWAYELFPELKARRNTKAGLLSGGEQQMLVIARALVGRPKVVLIDEMSAGLAPVVVTRLMRAVRQLADDGLAIVLVEQFPALALTVGDRAYVMRRGRMVYTGACAELKESPGHLHHLYLGDSD